MTRCWSNLETWCNALESYRQRHEDDPAVVAAIRARLDEIENASAQLQTDWDKAAGLVPGDEARKALDTLWRRAHRDVPVGAGINVIPTGWVEGGR